MTMGQRTCNPAALNALLDGELEPAERTQISEHLKHCRSCQEALQEFESISRLFSRSLEQAIPAGRLEAVEDRILTVIQKSRTPWWGKLKDILSSRRFYIPAAAAATALALFVYLTSFDAPESGPSAIINSFTGEITSVMILETPETRQTILWFHEISYPDEEDHDVKET